jgi:hypothetical protein
MSIALGLCAAVADAAPATHTVPDFSGIFARERELWLQPVADEGVGIPIEPILVRGPDRNNIYAGNHDNPILQPWAAEIVKRNAESELALKHVDTADDTCWPSGVPQDANRPDALQFIQTKDRVMIIHQRDQQVRWIWLNQKHSANPKPSWYGESVGHYEGDTLVIDTIGQTNKTFVDNYRTPHTEKLHVVERFRMVDEGKTLEVMISVDDPDTYNQPWTAVRRFNRTQATLGEEICQEGNFILFDYGIPVDHKPDF